MKPMMSRVLLTAVLWCTAALASAPEDTPASVPKGWVLHTVKEEGFQVALPRPPTLRRSTMQTAAGPAQITGWLVTRGHDVLMVGVSRLAPGLLSGALLDPDSLLQGMRDELASALRATVQSDRALLVAGPPSGPASYPARELELLLAEGTVMNTRIILAGDRLLMIQYGSKGTSKKSFHQMVASFSFL